MPAKKGYKVGESVFGLWPGSGGLYFKAVVVERDADEGTYDLKFEEGTVYTLLEKHVKPMDSFKSLEPKSGKRTVGRPRGRSGSASRSTSRSRSTTPGRRGRPPGSPNKGKKSPEVKKEDVTDDVPLNKRVSRAAVKQEVKEEVVASVEDVSRRRSTRLAVKTEVILQYITSHSFSFIIPFFFSIVGSQNRSSRNEAQWKGWAERVQK